MYQMRLYFRILLALSLVSAVLSSACHGGGDKPPRVLVFSKTSGYRHDCIPTAVSALRDLCKHNSIQMDSTEDAADFTEENLARYAAVVFLCTTGDVLDPAQENAFERYIQGGGGYMGIHSATDTEYGWSWYGGLAGAYFQSHPAQQEADLKVLKKDHPATRHLPDTWRRKDEWYNFKKLNPNVTVLLDIDEKSYTGGENGDKHPMSWYHQYDGGRAFYTALGHTLESYSEPAFMQHLLGGLRYAIGDNRRIAFERAHTPAMPDPTRFVKTVVADNLTEPMEFAMLPSGKILLIERRGAMKIYDPATGLTRVTYKMPVHAEQEDGLMGLALDPNYTENNWIYLYYSPVGNTAVNNLSRFVFRGDTLDRASEKIILQVAVQRVECCHAGGCIEFDRQGNLYLSTGDNTNPFASNGYAPIDERPGRKPWDAQGSSANTMDLRGKILRIRPLADGSYECPAGNLFAPQKVHCQFGMPAEGRVAPKSGGQGGAPEIYVMGCRNPFRLSLDQRRDLLFWGEVGPDAGEPDSTRGPAGHDEVNRAARAGFFGWPYFVGNNKPYRDYNFASGKSGPHFDPEHPINDSPNNTGARELPPAQAAFIWYPYGNSPEFPLTGNGGRNAMAGPTYYCDLYPEATRFPDYYNGKLITYDWMRNWMMAITIDSMNNFGRMEILGDSIRLSRPMDMFVDANGSLWVLEYGTQWFASNPDARISRIDYVRGNRPPQPQLNSEKTAGGAPLSTLLSVGKTRDYDNDLLDFQLDFGDGSPVWKLKDYPSKRLPFRLERAAPGAGDKKLLQAQQLLDSIQHTYEKPGRYLALLTVRDKKGLTRVDSLEISVGNEPPLVYWDFNGKNRSFYTPGDTLKYRVVVTDKEDGSLDDGHIPASAVAATLDFMESGFDISAIAQGHQSAMQQAEYSKGKILVDRSDCKVCHAIDRKVNGPSYQAVAERYKDSEFAVRTLVQKIIKGGAGNWGETVMSAHPQISEEAAGEIVRWILSLGSAAKPKQNIALAGREVLRLPAPSDKKQQPVPGTFLLRASYRDRGANGRKNLDFAETIALRPAFQQAESADSLSRGILTYRPDDGDTVVLRDLKNGSFVVYKHVDLQGIHQVALGLMLGDKRLRSAPGHIEVRIGSPKGQRIGKAALPGKNTNGKKEFAEALIPLEAPKNGRAFQDLYFVIRNEKAPAEPVAALDWLRFDLR